MNIEEQKIKIISNTTFINSLMEETTFSTFRLKQIKPADQQKSDTAMLVAIITGSATNLGILITGIFSLLAKAKDRHVKITGKNGMTLEFPADYDEGKIEALIEKANKLGVEKIQIS
ncbi:MAG: hypothetical protein V4594_05295 [Bacteroidota bacterium]